MNKEDMLKKFYYEFVERVSIDKNISDSFFMQLVTSVLLSAEEKDIDCTYIYENILLWSMLYNSNKVHENISVEEALKTFFDVDYDYYVNILKKNDINKTDNLTLMWLFMSIKANSEKDKRNSLYCLMQDHSYLIDAYDEFKKLCDINRTGWIMRNVDSKIIENDAAHTLQMVALASAYFRIYKPTNVDFNKVMQTIIIHEIGETVAGDIAEVSKEHDEKFEREYAGVLKTFKDLKNGAYFINLWVEFEMRETEEAKLVYYLDKLDAVLKAKYYDEVLNRNDLFDEFYIFEEKRETFVNSELKRLFYSLNNK